MSSWIPLTRLCTKWQVRMPVALRRIEKLVENGVVEVDEERQAFRLTWPDNVVTSFAEIHAGSMTEG